jgi:protein MAK11
VKSLDKLTLLTPSGKPTTIVTTVSSDGYIRIFDLSILPLPSTERSEDKGSVAEGGDGDGDGQGNEKEGPAQIQPVASYDTKGTRLTCVCLADGQVVEGPKPTPRGGGKRKRDILDDEDEEEDEDEDEEDGEWEGDWGSLQDLGEDEEEEGSGSEDGSEEDGEDEAEDEEEVEEA